MLLDATKVHKHRSERRARIAKDWLVSDEYGAFMAKLSREMINNDIFLEAEAHFSVASFTVVRIAHKIPGNSSSQVPLAHSIFILIPARMILFANWTWPLVCGLDKEQNLI